MRLSYIFMLAVLLVFSSAFGIKKDTGVDLEWNPLKPLVKYIECGVCKRTSGFLHRLASNDLLVEAVVKTLKIGMLVAYSWEQSTILMDAYAPPVTEGVRNKLFNPDVVCETIIPVCPATHYRALDYQTEVEGILSDKPTEIKNDDFMDNLYDEIANDSKPRETVMFYHIADLHIDPEYQEGAKSHNCGNIICCGGDLAKKESDRAGRWGNYDCDLPIETLKQLHLT